MDDLLKAKQEAFDKELYHRTEMQRHERKAREYHLRRLEINDRIREVERSLAEPIKVVYG